MMNSDSFSVVHTLGGLSEAEFALPPLSHTDLSPAYTNLSQALMEMPPPTSPLQRPGSASRQKKLAEDISINEFLSPALQGSFPGEVEEEFDWEPLVSPALQPMDASTSHVTHLYHVTDAPVQVDEDPLHPATMQAMQRLQLAQPPPESTFALSSPTMSPASLAQLKRTPTSVTMSPSMKRQRTPRQKAIPDVPVPPLMLDAPMLSPMLTPQLVGMESPRLNSASPLIRPVIKAPNSQRILSQEEVSKLETRSNYQNLMQGSTSVLGVSSDSELVQGVGQRKLTHKTAEQRRRDFLKCGYEDLRDLLPNSDKSMSKVEILRKVREYVTELEQKVKSLEEENRSLRAAAFTPPLAPASKESA